MFGHWITVKKVLNDVLLYYKNARLEKVRGAKGIENHVTYLDSYLSAQCTYGNSKLLVNPYFWYIRFLPDYAGQKPDVRYNFLSPNGQ